MTMRPSPPGVTGALFRSAASAAHALLENAGVAVGLRCRLHGARAVLPLSLGGAAAVAVDCQIVEVRRRCSSYEL